MSLNNYIILPTYNERENISQLIPLLFNLYPEINVLVVDDSSPDGTADEVKSLQSKFNNLHLLLREKKEGLGKAYINAFEELLKKDNLGFIISMDADFSHNPKYVEKMLEEAKQYGLVIGSRHMKGGGIKNYSKLRHFLSKAGSIYCSIILRRLVWDWTNSFCCIGADYLREIDFEKLQKFSGYAFIIALRYQLFLKGINSKEIPIIFESRKMGQSKITGSIIWEEFLTPIKLILNK